MIAINLSKTANSPAPGDIQRGAPPSSATAPALHLLSPDFEDAAAGLLAAGFFSSTDLYLVDTVAHRAGETDPETLLALALATRAPRVGHVGVNLQTIASHLDRERADRHGPDSQHANKESMARWLPIDAQAWEAKVLQSPLVGECGQEDRPFVVQRCKSRQLLMSQRQWSEQVRVMESLHRLVAQSPRPAVSESAALGFVDRLLVRAPAPVSDEERQRHRQSQTSRAILAAARGGLTVVTGGPGTGKTFSVKRLIALLLSQPRSAAEGPLRLELAAPTGKAAVRMAEAMGEGLNELPLDEAGRARLRGLTPRTLHKLLGLRPDGTARHGRHNPLVADVVIVDEASMIDLVMMRRLLESIPTHARLVLLGDRDQLASVEAGTVLADIVSGRNHTAAAGTPTAALAASIVTFTESYRFRAAPRIAQIAADLQSATPKALARAAQLLEGRPEHAAALADPLPNRVCHLGVAPAGRPTRAQLDQLAAPYLDPTEGYAGALAAAFGQGQDLRTQAFDAPGLLRLLESYRVLAVHREGPLGVSGLLKTLEATVRAHLNQAAAAVGRSLPRQGPHWLGRPLLVTQNAYDVGLMNGDIGLVLPKDGRLVALFPVVIEGHSRLKAVPLSRLPPHQGALAMTVHKSQGSQFARVAMVLAGRPSPIETRELLYTAITRAQIRLDWLGPHPELTRALQTPVQRASGLADLLWP